MSGVTAEGRAVVKQLLCNFPIPQDSRLLQEHLLGALNWDTVWLHPRYKRSWRHSSRCTLCKRRTLDSRVGSRRSFITTYRTSSPWARRIRHRDFFSWHVQSLASSMFILIGSFWRNEGSQGPERTLNWMSRQGHPQWFLELWPHPQAKVPFPDAGGLKTNDLWLPEAWI